MGWFGVGRMGGWGGAGRGGAGRGEARRDRGWGKVVYGKERLMLGDVQCNAVITGRNCCYIWSSV